MGYGDEIRKIVREEIEKYSNEHHESVVAQIREIANEQIDEALDLIDDADEPEIEPEFEDEFGPVVTHFWCPTCGTMVAIEDAEMFQKIEVSEEN